MKLSSLRNFTLAGLLLIATGWAHAQPGKPIISQESYDRLASYALEWLRDHQDEVVLEKNESGFDRISLPAPKSLRGTVAKLRLNYWPTTGVPSDFADESVHNHPRYFESLIINGGYRHAVYTPLKGDDSDCLEKQTYSVVQVDKSSGKSAKSSGQKANLCQKAILATKQGDIVVMPTERIHRVLSATPGTLTLNIVFEDRSDEPLSYDVYLTENAGLSSIVVNRQVHSPAESAEKVDEIAGLLSQYNEFALDRAAQ